MSSEGGDGRSPTSKQRGLSSNSTSARDATDLTAPAADPNDSVCLESEDFVGFAAVHGAEGTEDLLECAAAYLSETTAGHGFAHPQLMEMIRDLPSQTDLRREDSLRAFGMLLRKGTFRKRERGLFVLSNSSRYSSTHQDKAG